MSEINFAGGGGMHTENYETLGDHMICLFYIISYRDIS